MSETQKSVNLPPLKSKDQGAEGQDATDEKYTRKNWDFFKKKKDPRKMHPLAWSKFMAYEEPSKDVTDAQAGTKQRLMEMKKKKIREGQFGNPEDFTEKMKHEKLIGQLKASEARNRIRVMRLRYEANRSQEINHLIMCQPTARKAVRLQALLPAKAEYRNHGDTLDKLSRGRIEVLLEDTQGLLTGRT